MALPDAPDGTSLTGQRHLPAYAEAIGRAIDFGRSRAALPVWLIGTSAGTWQPSTVRRISARRSPERS